MIRSMTGYGRGEIHKSGKKFIVEIRTVNHKYSDTYIKLPRQISFLEEKVRYLVTQYVSRGKADVYVTYEDMGDESKKVLVDRPLASTVVNACRFLKDEYDLYDDISVALVARFPDVLRIDKEEEDEEKIWGLLKNALDVALQNLVTMRETEGKKLKIDVEQRLDDISVYVDKIEKRASCIVDEYRQKLETRIKELTEQQTIDENRLSTEVVYFAEKSNINEEVVRLKSHVKQMGETLETEKPVGRKLDFLIQEMHREANTIGSKSSNIDITKCVVEIKTEIDKIREQMQNIE